jgi:hypothetical protein
MELAFKLAAMREGVSNEGAKKRKSRGAKRSPKHFASLRFSFLCAFV